MKTLAVISLLALLTISGAAYTDQLFTSDQHATLGTNWIRPWRLGLASRPWWPPFGSLPRFSGAGISRSRLEVSRRRI